MTYTLDISELTPELAMRENLADMTPFQAACTRAALGIKMVFKRETAKGRVYLSERYEWGDAPNGFSEWEEDGLQAMFLRMPDPPTHWGWCDGSLDNVEWVEL